jgi:uncharacterized protein YacL
LGHSQQGALVVGGLAAIIVAIELIFERIQLTTIVFGSLGAICGYILGRILYAMVIRFDEPTIHNFLNSYSVVLYILFAYLGAAIAIKKKDEMDLLDKNIVVKGKNNKDVKVLDTSVLIDGRIVDVAETGFFSGRLIIPAFVLHELQMVADSQDAMKRQRGRRGLDILKRLQEGQDINVKIYDKDFPNIKEVDTKLIELAKELGAKIATTDFNLNKVAALQGVGVLNVNDLANALKPVVLPGDNFAIYLAKEGKEKAQSVGYLDDGTMIVVDEARRFIGKRVDVSVNSILQTSAGRMIFARLAGGPEPTSEHPTHPA